MWCCFLCQSSTKRATCCDRKTCEHSTFRTPRIEEYWAHLEACHPEVARLCK